MSWDDKYFRTSTAYCTTSAFQLVGGMNSDLPVHKIQSAAAMLRQSGNILDVAKAICSRSNRVLGSVNLHRVHLLMKGLCRTDNSCKPGLVVGAPRNGLCTATRFHTAEENSGCILGCSEGLVCLRNKKCCPTLLDHLNPLWPGANECISPTAILNDLLFKIVVRSDMLCILVSGLLESCVTPFNLRRTHRGIGINFKELMYGKIKDENCPVSGVGPHVSVDVLGF